jgi:hypothetical protein
MEGFFDSVYPEYQIGGISSAKYFELYLTSNVRLSGRRGVFPLDNFFHRAS